MVPTKKRTLTMTAAAAASSKKRAYLPSPTALTPSSTPTPEKMPKPNCLIDDEVALSVFQGLNCTDNFLNSGKVLAWAVQPDDPAFLTIHDYISRGQEHGFGIKILSIIRIIPKANDLITAPLDFNEDPTAVGKLRMMLWHGTRASVVPSILENGLQLPPLKGQMYGTGIYFADRVSKSVQYCGSYVGGVAYLFLSDVLLGNVFNSTTPMLGTTTPPTTFCIGGQNMQNVEYDSIRGCGINVPDKSWNMDLDGVVWPVGPTVKNMKDGPFLSLQFNEYIVYNTKQVQPKYLVKVELTANPVYEALY